MTAVIEFVTTKDILAYVEGGLSPANRAVVESAIAQDPKAKQALEVAFRAAEDRGEQASRR